MTIAYYGDGLYEIVPDNAVENLKAWGIETFQAEIPNTRVKYFHKAGRMWDTIQGFLEKVHYEAAKHPDKVVRFND